MKILAILAAVVAHSSDDKISITPTYKVDSTLAYKFEMKFESGGRMIVVRGKQTRTVKKVEGDTVNWAAAWADFTAVVNDQDMDIPTLPVKFTEKKTGEITNWDGGVEQLDNTRFHLMARFVAPAAPVGPGEEYKLTFKAKDVQPAYTYTGKYVGPEKLGDVETFKFTATYAEAKADDLSAKIEFWVKADGTVLKAVSKFTNFDIPPAGGPQTGTATYTIDKS